MGYLKIIKVIYWGKRYHFESPEFTSGLNIIEGKNGTGKTTFSNLICFALGIHVRQFDSNERSRHVEICNDEDNFVLLTVEISNHRYNFKRFFNNNTIFIEDSNGKMVNLPINRAEIKQTIFSDWLLSKLDIEVIEIFQGSRRFKINISDLFRLIHHDQYTAFHQIYKEHRSPNNFIVDSVYIRKVIFEMLTGYQFSEYYSMLGDLNKLEKEKEAAKATTENYEAVLSQMSFNVLSESTDNLHQEKVTLHEQLDRVLLYRESLKEQPPNVSEMYTILQLLRSKLFDNESIIVKYSNTNRRLMKELTNLNLLKEDMILEVTQIEKILTTQKHLDLFSQNTCPCCLNIVERDENHCICGKPLNDLEYERFFYSAKEYLDILKSKQKSVLTVDTAIESCQEEIKDISEQLNVIEDDHLKTRIQIQTLEKDVQLYVNDYELNQTNDKILELEKNIQDIEQKQAVYIKYQELLATQLKYQSEHEVLKKKVTRLELNLSETIESTIKEFNEIFNELVTDVANDVHSAIIDSDDYMPIINEGVYKQASFDVTKRLMYFVTLLKMSLRNSKMPFPRFLLIDTPENLGIDKENLDKCLIKIVGEPKINQEQFQVIMTTGIKKYPKNFNQFLRLTISSDKLLTKKDLN